MRLSHKLAGLVVLLMMFSAVGGCAAEPVDTPVDSGAEEPVEPPPPAEEDAGEDPGDVAGTLDWTRMELTDVATGETFTIEEFSGTPVFVQAFAVW